MSPKQTVKNPTSKRNNAEKMPKRTVRKEKLKLNMPANIKVSIPLSTTVEGIHIPIVRGRRPPQFKKHLDPETQVELANTVARQQLVKEEIPTPPFEPDNVVLINIPKKGRKAKKKVVVSEFFENRVIMDNNIAEGVVTSTKMPVKDPPEKKPAPTRRIVTRKRLADSTAQESVKRPKVELETDTEILNAKIKLENNAQAVEVPVEHETAVELQPMVTQPQPPAVQSESTAKKSKLVKRQQPIAKTVESQLMAAQPQSSVVPLQPPVVQSEPTANKSKPVKRSQPIAKKVVSQPTAAQPQSSVVPPQPPVVQSEPTAKKTKPIKRQQLKAKKVESHSTAVQPQSSVEPRQSPVVQSEPTANKLKPIKRPQPRKPPAIRQPAVARKKRIQKGKQASVGADNISPSILDQLRNLPKKDMEPEVPIKQNETNTPGPVESRKTSVSSNSNLSWTKDISSSSTTTCITVGSNDFVRFNKKLPILKLTNIDNELKKCVNNVQEIVTSPDEGETDEDSSDSSDSESSDSEISSDQLRDSIEVNSLHLSASSPPSRLSQSRSKDSVADYAKAAHKLTLTMEKLDMEIINWMSSETEVSANLVKFRDKMFEILDNEFGVITHCRRLKEIMEPPKFEDIIDEPSISEQVPDKNANNDVENAPVEETTKETEFVKPLPCRKLSSTSEGNISNGSTKVTRDESPEREMLAGTSKNYSYYDHHDDDDALSLFAESITGFESVRMTSSIAPSVPVTNTRPTEEYVPKPVQETSTPNKEKHTYYPTKIQEDTAEVIAFNKIKTICEKQNADSTSIYKQSNSTDDAESYQDYNEHSDLDTRIGPPDTIKKPRLMDSYFERMHKVRSVVFGNLCFYNLMNCCRKIYYGKCLYRHEVPTSEQIKVKLNLLDERMLIREYLLLRNWAELRRRYGMCYVEESAKRGLTRILVEMAYDFIVKARNASEEDTRLRVDTIEVTLLHLNTVDLSVCEDLLKLTIHSDQANRTLLCDVFMATMSITQNFSRFKIVFLNLTYFMVDNDRTFNSNVVEHILERVCILPFEEPIARALIQMMRLTKSDIFNNSMIGHFEKQISANKDVFEEYMLLKNQCAFTSILSGMPSSVLSGSPSPADQPLSLRPDNGDGQPPAPSPDTTNVDKMNKTADEPPQPIITRTIGMNPPIMFNRGPTSPGPSRAHDSSGPSRTHDNPGPSRTHDSPGPSRTHTSSDTNSDDPVTLNIRQWRNRSIFSHMLPPKPDWPTMRPPRPPMRPPRPQMRPPQKTPFNQRLVTCRSPSNYGKRQPGPKY